eukprot:m.85494 g.85494  ORF g.85494 m.85494 type:complete len:294 (+) comp14724_c0_seq15:206-1087(+)
MVNSSSQSINRSAKTCGHLCPSSQAEISPASTWTSTKTPKHGLPTLFPSPMLSSVTWQAFRRKLDNIKRMQQRQQDQKLLDSRQLRSQRIEALQTLRTQAQHQSIEYHGVPDGPATMPTALEDHTSDIPAELQFISRACYICKSRFTELHHFYDLLCPDCASLNWTKRYQTAELTDRVALVTGGRIKIGYQIVLKLLRAGATVVVTTRFPQDALRRYQEEEDAADWLSRLQLYGLDLRNLAATEAFCSWLKARHDRYAYGAVAAITCSKSASNVWMFGLFGLFLLFGLFGLIY